MLSQDVKVEPFQAARNQVFHHSNVVHSWGCIATASLPWKTVRSCEIQWPRPTAIHGTFVFQPLRDHGKIGNLGSMFIQNLQPKLRSANSPRYIQLLLLKTCTQRLKIKLSTLLTSSHNILSFHCPSAEQANDVHCCQDTLTCACLADSMLGFNIRQSCFK